MNHQDMVRSAVASLVAVYRDAAANPTLSGLRAVVEQRMEHHPFGRAVLVNLSANPGDPSLAKALETVLLGLMQDGQFAEALKHEMERLGQPDPDRDNEAATSQTSRAVGNTVTVGGDVRGSQIALGSITNSRRVRISLGLGLPLVAVLVVLFATTRHSDSGSDTGPRASGAAESGSTNAPVVELPSRPTSSTTQTAEPTGQTDCETRNPSNAEDPHVLDREPPTPDPPAADTPPDALVVSTLIEGDSGQFVNCGNTVVVHYVGVLADGTVFDSSWGRGPFTATIGVGQVIEGWDVGLVGAQLGERRHLVIGSNNAYGAAGSGDGSIPPEAPLAFDVDIIAITG